MSRLRMHRLAFVLLALAAVTACGRGTIPSAFGRAPNGPAVPTIPPVTPGAPQKIYTIYAFANTGAEHGLPVSPSQDGTAPKGTLTLVTVSGATYLYGRTAAGGNSTGCGIVFRVLLDGAGYTPLYRFSGTDGCSPRHDAMVIDPFNDLLYFTTQGVNNSGSPTYNPGQIIALDPASGNFTTLHDFQGPSADGEQQHSSFSVDPNLEVLYGQSALGGKDDEGFLYYVRAATGSMPVGLHSFKKSEGDEPHGRIVQIGQTLWGITRKHGTYGYGSVFSVAIPSPLPTSSVELPVTVVHQFSGMGNDGAHADHGYLTPVTEGGKTVLYGLTQCGGSGDGGDASGCKGYGDGDGVVFQVDPKSGTYHTVYAFRGTKHGDGADPYGSLYYDATSNKLYGTTQLGGSNDDGTVFKIDAEPFGSSATPKIVYNFSGSGGDGKKPIDNVVLYQGYLYGMTVEGGSKADGGTIFAIPVK